jgi:putative aldouronate transport system substrate-binding protein
MLKKFGVLLSAFAIMLMVGAPAVFGQAKPKSIKLMIDGTFQVKENGEQILVDGYKALTGIDLILNHPIHNEYYAKVDVAFVTGDIPDVLILGGNSYLKYAQSGQLVDLSAFYDKSPIKASMMGQGIIDAMRVKGKLYGIPFERGNGTITYVRGDWLEKLKMKVPTNYAEFIEMLRAFKNRNPDGFTPDQVIPITAAGLINSEFPLDIYLREFYQDAVPDFVIANGKWVDGMTLPNMVAAMDRMRSAYAEGLIDKEIITNKTSTARDKFYTGKVGAFNYWAGAWNVTLQQNLAPNVPQGKVIPIPAIAETKYIERVPAAFCITKAAKDPAAVWKYFIEFSLDGGPGQTWASFGVEGSFFKIVNGKIEFLPSMVNPKNPHQKGFISPTLPVNNWNSRYTMDPVMAASLAMFQAGAKNVSLVPYSEEAAELVPDINMIRGKYIAKIVFGETTTADGLAAYAKEVSKYTRIVLKELNQ